MGWLQEHALHSACKKHLKSSLSAYVFISAWRHDLMMNHMGQVNALHWCCCIRQPVGHKYIIVWFEYLRKYSNITGLLCACMNGLQVIIETLRLSNPVALLWREAIEDVPLHGIISVSLSQMTLIVQFMSKVGSCKKELFSLRSRFNWDSGRS